MRDAHKKIFSAVARSLNCWIGLREPNPLAEQWLGRPGYIPKPRSCKAKTADAEGFRFAGLVVNPEFFKKKVDEKKEPVIPFRDLDNAIKKWREFAPNNSLPPGYNCSEIGNEAGVLNYQGSAIYSDYDLLYISESDENGRPKLSTDRIRGSRFDVLNYDEHRTHLKRLRTDRELFTVVQWELNEAFGVNLIQHGAEFALDFDGIGTPDEETVIHFSPKGQIFINKSKMPKGLSN